jgi:competence protein ComEC
VSGKHTALMLAGVIGLCAMFGVGARERRVVALLALAWFVVLVRWQPSVLRAGGMAVLVLVAGLLGRARLSVRLLWAAVLLLVLADPLLAGRLGFVLSVLATAGVLAVSPKLVPRLRGPRWLRWTAAATVGAQLGVAPVLLGMDGGVPPGALPANLVAGPAAAVAQTVGLVAGALAQVSEPAAGVLAELAGPFLSVILWSARAFAGLPAIEWRHVASPVAALLALGGVSWAARRRGIAAAVVAVAVAVAVMPVLRGPVAVEHLTLTAFDVGQGDALLVEAPCPGGRTARLLFDGGPEPEEVVRHLRARRIDAIDVVVMSHGHADHATGLPAVLEAFDVGVVLLGAHPDPVQEPPTAPAGDLMAVARSREVPVHLVADGDRFGLGEATASVLSPPRDRALAGGDLNENSVVLRVDGPHGSLLLTGDAEVDAQRRLLAAPHRVAVDVLQVPHHGGATNLDGFLTSTGADIAVISVGADNDYGHPHPGVLAELAAAGIDTARTDLDGTVTVTVGPDGPQVRRRTARRVGRHSPCRKGSGRRRTSGVEDVADEFAQPVEPDVLWALTHRTSTGWTPQPSARSRLRRSRRDDLTLSCLVATTWNATSWARSHASISRSRRVGPTSPSTSSNVSSSSSRSRRYRSIRLRQASRVRADTLDAYP